MKEIKIVLGKLLEDWADGKVDNPDKALAEIKKIFSKWVGEDRTYDIDPTSCEPVNEMDRGYNQRGAEIRKKLEGEL